MLRNFRLIGSPYLLPPGVPKERADILKEAFRKTFNDPEFFKAYRRLTGGEASPMTPEEQERTIKETPREREVIDLFNKIAGAGPLPLR
jgi:tripartite-type tricarboxylate transporter receptor subunit TctC